MNASNYSMNTLKIELSYDYASQIAPLTWSDILFAMEQGFMQDNAAIEHAVSEVKKGTDSLPAVMELACLLKGESIYPFITEIENHEGANGYYIARRKLLFLVLWWLFENRTAFREPLEAVEIVYADFDYPPTIANFVRYMPTEDPFPQSIQEGTRRMYDNWKYYLDTQLIQWRAMGHGNHTAPDG